MEEKKRKLYIKERRAACDLIAKKNGRAARTPEDVQTVANMSDDDIIKLLTAAGFWDDTDAAAVPGSETNKTAAPEKITTAAASPVDPEQTHNDNIIKLDAAAVEELRPDGGALVDLKRTANNIIINYINSNGWQPDKITPANWGACCMACGRVLRSSFRIEQKNCIMPNNIKEINIDAVADAVEVWRELCMLYNKVPLINDFCDFIGINKSWLYKYLGVTSSGVNLLQILQETRRDGLEKRALNPKENPLAPIKLLEYTHGYNSTSIIKHETIKGADGSANLPDFGSFQALEDKNS